mmetsp:Transcript_19398/g.34567  ORF Transcript_19398/g.34567 Transcript_19398/m.34567 type:complete len:708 (+) Transcript_19398:87-2210(+)
MERCGILLSIAAAFTLGLAGLPCAVLSSTLRGDASDAMLSSDNNTQSATFVVQDDYCFVRVPLWLASGDTTTTRAGVGVAMLGVAGVIVIPALLLFLLGRCYATGGSSVADDSSSNGKHMVKWLYYSHFLSVWGDRMWQMALPMVFMDLFKDTLLPTATYTLVVYISVLQVLPSLGSWIDRSNRLKVQQTFCAVENVSILSTSAAVCFLITQQQNNQDVQLSIEDTPTMLCFGILLLAGIAGELANNASTVSLEKDWVVVMAKSMGVTVTDINTKMRRIDLACKAISPAVFALLYEQFGDTSKLRIFFGMLFLGVWNAMSYPLEILTLRLVFHAFEDLHYKLHEHSDGTKHAHPWGEVPHYHVAEKVELGRRRLLEDAVFDPGESDVYGEHLELYKHSHQAGDDHGHGHGHSSHGDRHGHGHGERAGDAKSSSPPSSHDTHYHILRISADGKRDLSEYVISKEDSEDSPRTLVSYQVDKAHSGGVCGSFFNGLGIYRAELMFLASLGYTMLYMTVLDNGTLMISYLQWAEVKPVYFAMGRGAGAVLGLVGTFAYPALCKFLGNSPASAGLLTVWLFWFTMLPIAVVMVAAPDATETAIMVSMAASRIWLWSFDMAITELGQTMVSEQNRGLFGTVETSMSQLFYVVVQLAGMLSPDPSHFTSFVWASLVVVFIASGIYSYWFFRVFRTHVSYKSLPNESSVSAVELA